MGLHRFISWSVIKVQNIRISLYIKHTGLVFLLTSPYYWDCTVLVGLNSFIVKDITLMLCCISNALTYSELVDSSYVGSCCCNTESSLHVHHSDLLISKVAQFHSIMYRCAYPVLSNMQVSLGFLFSKA